MWRSKHFAALGTACITPTWSLSVRFPESQATALRGRFSSAHSAPARSSLRASGHRKDTHFLLPSPSLQDSSFPVHFPLLGHTLSCCLGHSASPLLTLPKGALLSALDCGRSASCHDAIQGLGRSLLAKCLLTKELEGLHLILRSHVEKLAGLVCTWNSTRGGGGQTGGSVRLTYQLVT